MKECGTRWRNTSDRSPPVCTFVRYTLRSLTRPSLGRTAKAVMVFRVFGLISAGMNARMKLGTLGHQCVVDGRRMISVHESMVEYMHCSRADVECP